MWKSHLLETFHGSFRPQMPQKADDDATGHAPFGFCISKRRMHTLDSRSERHIALCMSLRVEKWLNVDHTFSMGLFQVCPCQIVEILQSVCGQCGEFRWNCYTCALHCSLAFCNRAEDYVGFWPREQVYLVKCEDFKP